MARSFARIRETNLKKLGVLPLTFKNLADHDSIHLGDCITLADVEEGELKPDKEVTLRM